jgi:hypothetical protein
MKFVYLFTSLWVGILFSFVLQGSLSAHAEEYQAHIERGQNPITGLELLSDAPVKNDDLSEPVQIRLQGKFPKLQKEWGLLIQTTEIEPVRVEAVDEGFEVPIALNAGSVDIEFLAIDPSGKIYSEKVRVSVARWAEIEEFRKSQQMGRGWNSSLGLSSTFLSYQEGSTVDYSATLLTAKGGVNYLFPASLWEAGFSAYVTALPISTSIDVAARFIGLNLRGGYRFNLDEKKWRVVVLGGWYYTTMFVENSAFGFRNMQGPQLFPSVSYVVNERDSANLYLKYSPVGANGIGGLSFSNHEKAIGGAYTRRFKNGRSASVTVDVASFELLIDGVPIESNSISVGLSLGI